MNPPPWRTRWLWWWRGFLQPYNDIFISNAHIKPVIVQRIIHLYPESLYERSFLKSSLAIPMNIRPWLVGDRFCWKSSELRQLCHASFPIRYQEGSIFSSQDIELASMTSIRSETCSRLSSSKLTTLISDDVTFVSIDFWKWNRKDKP